MKRMAVTFALVGASTMGLANTAHAISLPAPSALKEAVPSNTSQVFGEAAGAEVAGVQESVLELRPVCSQVLR